MIHHYRVNEKKKRRRKTSCIFVSGKRKRAERQNRTCVLEEGRSSEEVEEEEERRITAGVLGVEDLEAVHTNMGSTETAQICVRFRLCVRTKPLNSPNTRGAKPYFFQNARQGGFFLKTRQKTLISHLSTPAPTDQL